MSETKICKCCGLEKPIEQFVKRKKNKDGRCSECYACAHKKTKARCDKMGVKIHHRYPKAYAENTWRKQGINMTYDQYLRMYELQDGKCAICGEECESGMKLAVDHDHLTGKVRGLLCFKCNTALGRFNDSIDLVRKALNYLVINI